VKRVLALVLCCCALAVACAEKSNAPAATVNGTTVTAKDLADELDAIKANPEYLNALDTQFKQSGQAAVGSAPGTFDPGFVGTVLFRQLQFALTHSEVQRRNLEASDECKASASNDLTQNLGQGDAQKGEATLAKFPEAYRNRLQGWYVDEWVLQADLVHQPCGGAGVAQAYFDTHPDDFTQMCVSLASVNDENLANSIVAQTRAGADFAALAQQYSTDAQTASGGGDAGCHLPAEFPSTIAPTVQATQVGGVTDPISDNGGGFYIIKVNDRKPQAFTDVSSEAEQLALRDQAVELRTWLSHALTDAKVTVNPRYGTFDPSTGQITPPASNSSAPGSGSQAPPSASDVPAPASEAPSTPGP